MPTQEQVIDVLKTVKFPGLSRDIVSFGFIKDVKVDGGDVAFTLHFQTENPGAGQQSARDAEAAVKRLDGVSNVRIKLDVAPRHAAPAAGGQEEVLPGVK